MLMEFTYYTRNFECESCAKIISKVVARFPGASLVETDLSTGKIVFESEEADEQGIVKEVGEKGFVLSKTPIERNAAFDNAANAEKAGAFQIGWQFIKSVLTGSSGFQVERMLLEAALITLVLVAGLGMLASYALPSLDGGSGKFIWLMPLIAVAVGVNSYVFWHSRVYRREFTCMSGMMIGMTIGMISGFMIGALVAASSGMFAGSVIGMAVGMLVGAYCGYCCGIMGTLEGLMAGVMGGIMGAMTTIMMLNDHLLEFLYILFAACALVMGGLSYMIYKEAGSTPGTSVPPVWRIIAANVIAAVIIIAIMVVSPKGPLAWVVFN